MDTDEGAFADPVTGLARSRITPTAASGAPSNRRRLHRRALSDLWSIDSTLDFHRYLIDHAVGRYHAVITGRSGAVAANLGSVLAVGANHREASMLQQFPFDRILLTGIVEPEPALLRAADDDPRIRYQRQNLESLPFESGSFDLVFCKETLHHLARPVLGLYEMLRVCRRGAILIEPCESQFNRVLERVGLSSVYETDQSGNPHGRDNFVYRWNRGNLESLLSSYYLESGYGLDWTVGWMSARYNAAAAPVVRRAAAIAGWLLGFVPGSRGNYATALITPGRDLPPDPAPLNTRRTVD